MPRGKKKTTTETIPAASKATETTAKEETVTAAEVQEEVKAPAKAKAEKKSKTGRKPRAKKEDKAAPVQTAAETKTADVPAVAESVRNEKPKAKTGRKPSAKKEDKAVPAEKPKRAYNRKSTADKSEDVVFQSGSNNYSLSDITELCKKAYRNGGKKQIKTIKVYVKPENGKLRAYYVVNGNADGAFIDL